MMSVPVSLISPMSHKFELREGACIITDAHYSQKRPQLLAFFQAIYNKEIAVPQLILLGDIFDALFGSITYTCQENREMITLLEAIAKDTEVIYFEGNHDFNLKKVFKNITVFPLAMQPVLASYEGKKIYFAHGDFDGKMGYKLYTALIRNQAVLYLLWAIDTLFNHIILKKLEAYLDKKDDCKELVWFDEFIENRFQKRFACDYFIEGHFHQNKTILLEDFTYINLAAFACNQRYFIVKSTQDKELLEQREFSKEM